MGIFSKIFGGSESESKSVQNADQVYQAQQPFLANVWGRGQNLANQQMAAGSNFQNQLQTQQRGWQDLMAGSQNPYLQGMASNAMGQISKQFNEQIMPSLLGGGNAAGQLGGERYQLLQNSAVDTAARAMGDVGNDVYGRAWDSGLQGQIAALGQSGAVQQAAWQPLLAQKSLVGNPTVLGQGGTTTSTATNDTGIIPGLTNLARLGGTPGPGAYTGR